MIYSTVNHQELPFSDHFDDVILEWSHSKKIVIQKRNLVDQKKNLVDQKIEKLTGQSVYQSD